MIPKKNILANYVGQIYVMAVSILIMPLYIKYLGAEAYGLVGFFIMMQVWLNILDAGFSPTLGRQIAEARGDNSKFENFFKLLRSLEIIFLLLSFATVIIIYSFSAWISSEWIKANTITQDVIQHCVILMGLILSIRWFTTIYKSGINGFEDQVWLNQVNVLIATLKYFGALFILIFISQGIKTFFYYQLLIGVLEVVILSFRMYYLLPVSAAKGYKYRIKIDINSIKEVLPFSISIAITTIIWTLLMQVDKLMLSSILTLDKFGFFTIIVLVSSSLMSIATPVFLAILPRMTLLLSNGENTKHITIYKNMTQLVTLMVLTSSLIIYIYSEQILYILIGDLEAALWGTNILKLYVLGYAFFVLSNFQYYLQNSLGNLKYYLRGVAFLAIFQVPVMYYAVLKYGALGSGIIWLSFNFLWFVIFTWIVHHKFLPNFHLRWILKDILPIIIAVICLSFLIQQFFFFEVVNTTNRWVLMFKIIIVASCILITSSISIDIVRNKVKQYIKGL